MTVNLYKEYELSILYPPFLRRRKYVFFLCSLFLKLSLAFFRPRAKLRLLSYTCPKSLSPYIGIRVSYCYPNLASQLCVSRSLENVSDNALVKTNFPEEIFEDEN